LNALLRNRLRTSLFILSLFATATSFGQAAAYDSTLLLMGTRFELKAVCESPQQARVAVEAGIDEIRRIEAVISSHRAGTGTTIINQNAGVAPVPVDEELFNLIARSLKISKLTDGAFDISFGALYRIWKFDGSMHALPSADTVLKYQNLTGYEKITLDPQHHSVYLPQKGMSIGFGAIGKGYAANRAKQVMVKLGSGGGFVNAAGDILFWGHNEHHQKWNVAIASPFFRSEVIGGLEVENMAVVTSGNYEKNFTIDGKTYSHIVDPKTGYPTSEAVSVTIICPDAELADALATGVSVLGVADGIKLINQLKGFECLIIDSKGRFHQSSGLNLDFKNQSASPK
jgi:FAD:protein FMN transferase